MFTTICEEEVAFASDNQTGLSALQARILELLEENQWDKRDVFGIRLGLEEALVNAVKHGNKMNPNKKVYVRYRLAKDRVSIEVRDEGEGFNPAEVPDPTANENLERPCGRGVMLMFKFITSVVYNKTGNCVTITQKRSDAEVAVPA